MLEICKETKKIPELLTGIEKYCICKVLWKCIQLTCSTSTWSLFLLWCAVARLWKTLATFLSVLTEVWNIGTPSSPASWSPSLLQDIPHTPNLLCNQINHLLSNFRLQVDLIPHENNCNVVALCFQFFLPPWSLKKCILKRNTTGGATWRGCWKIPCQLMRRPQCRLWRPWQIKYHLLAIGRQN